jgi:hypothetical protein
MVALYKYPQFLQRSDHNAFDGIHEAGVQTPYSGIYRCEGCGHCVTSVHVHSYPLPPQNHHQHTAQQGRIR